MKKFRILSIDGGGLRGMISAKVLIALENMLKAKIGSPKVRLSDCFDLIAGTSTGGILAAIYLCPSEKNPHMAKYTAEDALDFYEEYGPLIFRRRTLHSLISFGGLLGAKYPAYPLEGILRKHFKNVRLSQLLKPCLISAYDMTKRRAVFFNQAAARKNKAVDFYLRDVVRATSAAPTFFPVKQILSASTYTHALIDGGVFANNPSLCAYAEACKMGVCLDMSRLYMLSVGNATNLTTYSYKDSAHWGLLNWAWPILDILMDGVAQTVDYQMETMFRGARSSRHYLRIATNSKELGIHIPPMDDMSAKNLKLYSEIGDRLVEENCKRMEEFADFLIGSGTP